jgi:hypothetical protein
MDPSLQLNQSALEVAEENPEYYLLTGQNSFSVAVPVVVLRERQSELAGR